MALEPKFSIKQDLENGEELHFEDVTGAYDADTNEGGYGGGGNPAESDIMATRIVMGDYIRRDNAKTGLSSTDQLTLWDEYTTNSGSLAYPAPSGLPNTVNVNSYDPFVVVHDPSNLIATGLDVDETGRTLVRKDYLPSNSSPLKIVPDDAGLSGSTFPDRVYDIQYEVYVDLGSAYASASAGQVVAGEQYIVIPDDPTDTSALVQIGSTFYYRYQVFVPDSTQSISPSGATVYELEASVFKYFVTTFVSYGYYQEIFRKFAESGCDWEERYYAYAMRFALYFEAIDQSVSPYCLPGISGTTDLIKQVENQYNWLIKCLDQ